MSKKVKVTYVNKLNTDYKIVASAFFINNQGKLNRFKKKKKLKKMIEEEREEC